MQKVLLGVAFCLLSSPGPVKAQYELTKQIRADVIDGLSALLADLYVIPSTAEEMQANLDRSLEKGRYDESKTPDELAATVTADLQSWSGDQHLQLMYGDQLRTSPRRVVRTAPGEEAGGVDGPRVVIRRGHGAPQDEEGGAGPEVVRRQVGSGSSGGVFDNANGIPVAKVLPGNIGLVDIRLFIPREQNEADAIEAMETVADVDALIFDLRSCAGGAPDKVHLITSYLFSPEPMHLLTYYHAREEPDSAYTLAEIPGKRLEDADVYILTSARTASGGEEFSYNLKHHGRATLVGEVTAGAGHGGGVHPVAHGFHAFIPDFRPVHPKTGRGWEGVGVVPHVKCSAEDAEYSAHRLALRKLQERASQARQVELEAVLADLEKARASEQAGLDPSVAAQYVGRYGYRTISTEGGMLFLQREGGPKLRMVPKAQRDEFALKRVPSARIRFERGEDGHVHTLHVLAMSGEWEATAKESSD